MQASIYLRFFDDVFLVNTKAQHSQLFKLDTSIGLTLRPMYPNLYVAYNVGPELFKLVDGDTITPSAADK